MTRIGIRITDAIASTPFRRDDDACIELIVEDVEQELRLAEQFVNGSAIDHIDGEFDELHERILRMYVDEVRFREQMRRKRRQSIAVAFSVVVALLVVGGSLLIGVSSQRVYALAPIGISLFSSLVALLVARRRLVLIESRPGPSGAFTLTLSPGMATLTKSLENQRTKTRIETALGEEAAAVLR